MRFSWAILFVFCAIFGTAWIIESRVTPEQLADGFGSAEAPVVGYLAPSFELKSIVGDTVDLRELRGQPVVLNFWATWCGPCRLEMPHLQAVSEAFAGQAHVIGVNQGEDERRVWDFSAELGLTYPLLLDDGNAVNRTYRVRALPTTLIIDSEGMIHEIIAGTVNGAVLMSKLEAVIEN